MNEVKIPASHLTLADALAKMERQARIRAYSVDSTKLQIVVFQPGSIGGTPTVDIERMQAGSDWDNGKMMLYPARPLTTMSEEEKSAILQHAKDGQSYHAYQQHKRIKALEKEVADLKAAARAAA